MRRQLRWLREARSLFATDSRADTAAAILLVLVAVGPVAAAYWRNR